MPRTPYQDQEAEDAYQSMSDNSSRPSADVEGAMRDIRRQQDIKEKQDGSRFDDDGENIPGRRKGVNDRNPNNPASISPSIGAKRRR